MSAVRAIYTALVYALLPRALAHLYLRGRREPDYRQHVGERFGSFSGPGARNVIWIHAVSVGETRAAEPLIRALQARYPGERVLLTHMTPTGRATGEALFPEVLRAYLPYDFPGAIERFLDHFRPRLGLIMETEVWPNAIHISARRRIPLYLVNARLSEKSFRGYRRFARLSRETFGGLAGVCAQTEDDATRLKTLGARNVVVTGNLKFDVTPSPELAARGLEWRKQSGGRPVLLAASTRDGEEALLLHVLDRIVVPGLLLVIVPRHPQRFDEVASLLAARGISYVRRSEGQSVPATARVVLGDSMGEMAMYFAACDVVFIGGSLLRFGSQNFIEACALGKPVLIGPYTYNFQEAAERAIEAGAAVRVADAGELAARATALLLDPGERSRMANAALAFSRAHQGATESVLRVVSGAPAEASSRREA